MIKPYDWKAHYVQTKEAPHYELLTKALAHVPHRGEALDVGGGALRDTHHLLQAGFHVTNLDAQELPPEITRALDPAKFQHIVSKFADFEFPEGKYDLASAMFSLPFNPPDTFDRVFESIKRSLKSGGIFSANLFGPHDDWSALTIMTFHTKEQAVALLADMEVVSFEEREWNNTLASGEPKHWHTFEFIARKK